MPRYDTMAMLGNSLTGGVWATRPDNTFFAQFQNKLREHGLCNLYSIPKFPGGKGGQWGNVFLHWENVCREHNPDVILLQGAMEQDGGNTVTKISADLPMDSTSITVDGTLPSSPQLYYLYDPADPDNGEWILNTRSDGTRVWRGIFGTIPRYWPADTPVLDNPNKSLFTATKMTWEEAAGSRARLDAMLKHILRTAQGYQPIVLVCDVWFDVDPSWTAGIREYVQSLNRPNVGFVEYAKPDGTRIWADRTAIGPSANITGVATGAGSPAELTITCDNSLGVSQLKAGEYVALHDVSLGAFGHATVEIMKIHSVDYTAKTFVVQTAGRQQLGDTAITTFGDGDVVCKHSPMGCEMRLNFDTLGASGGFQDCWARDSHPNDYGYGLLAAAAWRTFRSLVNHPNLSL